MRTSQIETVFVHEVPRQLEPSKLYISMAYATALHLCCCGCGNEVVTPLHPTQWRLSYDGLAVTLHPSIGNWSLPCQSHYLIIEDRVRWARAFSGNEIDRVRARDHADIEHYFDLPQRETAEPPRRPARSPNQQRSNPLARLWRLISRR